MSESQNEHKSQNPMGKGQAGAPVFSPPHTRSKAREAQKDKPLMHALGRRFDSQMDRKTRSLGERGRAMLSGGGRRRGRVVRRG